MNDLSSRRRPIWPGAVSLLLLSVALPGQGDAPKRPAYQLLRQNEDWSVLRGVTEHDCPLESLKFLSLREDGAVWLSLGGEARLRGEVWDGFRFGAPATAKNDDAFLLTRGRLHADLHVGPHARAFVEGISAWVTERDLVGGRRSLDVNSADLLQAFVELKAPLVDDMTVAFRGGRQGLVFGRQRLVSTLPWANSMRAWDGVSVIADSPGLSVHAFLTQFAPVQKYAFDDTNPAIDFGGVYATRKPKDGRVGLDVYGLWLNRAAAGFNGTAGEENRYTVGARAWQGPKPGALDWDVEAAGQFGEQGNEDIAAWMVATQVGHTFDGERKPRVFVGFDYASGDERAGGRVQTFNQLFPLGHAHLGYIDVIGRQNIVDVSVGYGMAVTGSVKAALEGHAFWLADRSDALYDAGGAVVRPGGSSNDSFVGYEVDFTATWQANRHVAALLGLSWFGAGDMIENSGPSEDTLFGYLQATFTF